MQDQELQWMRALQEGDRSAFERLYHHFKHPLARFLYRQCGDSALVEDLLQEVFVRFWKGARRFRAESTVSTYLFRIAYHVAITEGLKRKRIESAASLDTQAEMTRPERPAPAEVSDHIEAALRTLAEGERSVFILSEINEFKYAEIAEILDIPVGTVKSRMSGAVRKLKEFLGPFMRQE